MLTIFLLIAAIVNLLFGAVILQSRHRSPRPLQRVLVGIFVLFIAGAFLDGSLLLAGGIDPSLRAYLAALPACVAISLVVGTSGSWARRGRRRARARDDDLAINPATGLPMSGGVGGVDAAGNSWGDGGDSR